METSKPRIESTAGGRGPLNLRATGAGLVEQHATSEQVSEVLGRLQVECCSIGLVISLVDAAVGAGNHQKEDIQAALLDLELRVQRVGYELEVASEAAVELAEAAGRPTLAKILAAPGDA